MILRLNRSYGEVVNLGKKIQILVTTVSRQALDIQYRWIPSVVEA